MSDDKSPPIQLAPMCDKHQSLLVKQSGYSEKDPWQALIVVVQIVLFQVATCDDRTHQRIGDDISKIGEIECLACFKPDTFGEIVEAAKRHDLSKIKDIGDRAIKIRALKP